MMHSSELVCWHATAPPSSSSLIVDQSQLSPPSVLRMNDLKLRLTYPGWQDNFIDAEHALLTHSEPEMENVHFFKMEEKERMFHGDRSHQRLVRLDSHCSSLSYPGWHLDKLKAEEAHVMDKNDASTTHFEQCLQIMLNKQRVHVGDRSHPDLVELDRLKRALSYPGWEQDVANAEKSHLTSPHNDFEDAWIFRLVEKQRMHYGDRSHVRLQELDSYQWTYPGWEVDRRVAEEEHLVHTKSPWFGRIVQAMKNRQRVFDDVERRSMAAVVARQRAAAAASTDSSRHTARNGGELTNCVICLTEPRSHAFIPCGHLCACAKCALETFGRFGECPICRQDADTTAQIFFS